MMMEVAIAGIIIMEIAVVIEAEVFTEVMAVTEDIISWSCC